MLQFGDGCRESLLGIPGVWTFAIDYFRCALVSCGFHAVLIGVVYFRILRVSCF